MKRRLMLALACSGFTFAANAPRVVTQGFSPDARYHLLLTEVVLDGSGFPSAALQITDVTRNRIVYSREQVWKEASGVQLNTLVRGWRASQAGVLKTYGLTTPIAGKQLFHVAPLPPLAYPATTTVNIQSQLGQFTLAARPLPSNCPSSDGPTQGFSLTLGPRVLQNDARLPASRACARGYHLETAWTYKSGLAVILRAYTRGFEGPDATPMVITGSLK